MLNLHRPVLFVSLFAALAIGLLACADGGSPSAEHQVVCSPGEAGSASLDVAAVASDVSRDVGQPIGSAQGTADGVVFVFDETHVSRPGQIEIAIMLLRLHDQYGLRNIALEGARTRQGTLDAEWFHSLRERTRQDVAIEVLKEGEISGAEFMALAFPDIGVHGIEDSRYEVELNFDLPGSPVTYLFAIAVVSMTETELGTVNRLLDEERDAEAIEFAVGTDPWTEERFERFTSDEIISVEELVALHDEIEQRSDDVGADVGPYREGFENSRQFYEAASKRSTTMVDNTLLLLGECPDTPMALNIGAAHTDLVLSLLDEHAVSYAGLRQLSLVDSSDAGELTDEAYERKLEGLSVDGEGDLGRILEGEKKPPTCIDRLSCQAKLDAYAAATMMATGAAAGKPPPFASQDELALLQHISLDLDSVELDGDEVIFSFDAAGDRIWVRTTVFRPEQDATLEDRLKRALEESKEDADRSVVKRTSPNTVALFSTDEDFIRRQRLQDV